jgi:hypothetical protein
MSYRTLREMEEQAFKVRNVPGTAAIEQRGDVSLIVDMPAPPNYAYRLNGTRIAKVQAADWLETTREA